MLSTFFGLIFTITGVILLIVGIVNSSIAIIIVGIVFLIVGLLILGLLSDFSRAFTSGTDINTIPLDLPSTGYR